MRTGIFLCFVAVLLLLTGAEAFPAVDVSLAASENIALGSFFDVTIRMEGKEQVGVFRLDLCFDPELLRMTAITPKIAFAAPAQSKIDEANTDGCITLSYLDFSLVGFSPGAGTDVAAISFEALAQGNAEILPSGSLVQAGFPPEDVTGTFAPLSLRLVDFPQEGVNARLEAPDSVRTTFEIELHMTGKESVGSFALPINFDKDRFRVTDILPAAAGVIVPDANETISANHRGTFAITGTWEFVPGMDSRLALIVCEPLVGNDGAAFEFDARSSVLSSETPPRDITGRLAGKSVAVSDLIPNLEKIREYVADYNEAHDTELVLGVPGDINGDGGFGLDDLILKFQTLNGGR